MTVRELIEILKTKPQDAEVLLTWEGSLRQIDDDNVYVSHDGPLIIDVDGNSSKGGFVSGPLPFPYGQRDPGAKW